MKNSQVVIKNFILGIFLSSIVLSPFLLDFTLICRFIFSSLFLGLAIYPLYQAGDAFKIKGDLVLLSFLSYVLFSCLSVFWSLNKAEALFEASKLFLAFLVFLLSYFSFRTHYQLFMDYLRKISVLLFYIIFLVAIYQYSQTNTSLGDWRYSISGINGHKNLLASFLFLNLFFLISAYRHLPKKWRLAALAALILSLAVLYFLKTKAVWIGLFVAMLTFGLVHLLKPSSAVVRWKTYLTIIICVIATNVFFLLVLQPLIQSNLTPDAGQPFKALMDTERLMLWDKTYYMIHHHPLFGTGVGNWQIYFPDAGLSGMWRVEDLNYTFQRPHNDLLWILSQTGIVGFNLFLLFIFSLLILFTKAIRLLTPDHFREATLCLAFIVGYYVISFFDFPMERMEHLIWIHILIGFAYYHIRTNVLSTSMPVITVSRPYYIATFILIAAISALGFFRYSGELNTRRMYDMKKTAGAYEVSKMGQAAKNFAYTLDPTSVPIDWYIGNANAALGNYNRSKRDFLEAYRLNPYNRNVLNDLGSSYSVNNKSDSAKFFYLEASRISPRFDDPKLNLVVIYIKEGNYLKASECLKTLYHDSDRRTKYQQIVDAMIQK